MKALRFHAAKDLRVEDIAQPTEPADDEVVIQNRFVGICGTDLHEYAYGPIFVPKDASGAAVSQVLGHEYGGVVTKVGKKYRVVVTAPKKSVVKIFRNGKLVAQGAKTIFLVSGATTKATSFHAVTTIGGAQVVSNSVVFTLRTSSRR